MIEWCISLSDSSNLDIYDENIYLHLVGNDKLLQ